MDVAIHLARPPKESPQVLALAPHEFPEFQKANLLHLDAGIGFDPPEKIRTSPRSEAMAFRRIPQKANLVAHTGMIRTKTSFDYVCA